MASTGARGCSVTLARLSGLPGESNEAAAAFDRALDLYEQKGNIVGAARVRALQHDLALV